jgi:hypothetical protein
VGSSPRPERCNVEIPSTALYDSPTRRFRCALFSVRAALAFQISCWWRDIPRTRARQVHSDGYQRLKSLGRWPGVAGSSLSVLWYDARSDRHHSEAFSLLAKSHSQLDKVPRRPRSVSTTAIQNEWASACFGFKRPAADLMTPTTSAAILSLYQQAPG